MALPVLIGNGAHLLLAGVAPAALDIAEGPARGDIAAAGETAESPGNGGKGILLDEVQVQAAALDGDHRLIAGGIAQIPGDFARVVQVDAEEPLRAEEDEEVMAAVKAGPLLGMVKNIAVPAFIAVAALINAADALAQAEEHFLRAQDEGEGQAAVLPFGQVEIRQRALLRRNGIDNGVRGQGSTKGVFANHSGFLTFCCLRGYCIMRGAGKTSGGIAFPILRNQPFLHPGYKGMITLKKCVALRNGEAVRIVLILCEVTIHVLLPKTEKKTPERLREAAAGRILRR